MRCCKNALVNDCTLKEHLSSIGPKLIAFVRHSTVYYLCGDFYNYNCMLVNVVNPISHLKSFGQRGMGCNVGYSSGDSC